jgi:hypothetical protein
MMSVSETIRFVIFLAARYVTPLAVAVEWMIAILAALAIFHLPGRAVRSIRQAFQWAACWPRLAVLVCGLLPIVIRLSLLPWIPAPEPSIHDEFSHLLLADTLSHGRLTNPTHPFWEHFESIHIIQRPTYNSMYPPAQAAFLALGQVVFHEPWAGVVISVGLMCAAICWMMQGWLPPIWAFLGTLVVILKIGVLGFWMNSYMGGAVPAIGGAFVIGSLPRLRRADSRMVHSVMLGLGLVLLMNSRPFEGSILSLAALAYLFPALWRRIRKNPGYVLKIVVLPAGTLVAAGLLFTGYYSWRVTGSPLRMPYMVNRDTYGWPENLAFLTPKKLTFRHQDLQDMYVKEISRRDQYHTFTDIISSLDTRFFDNWTFLIGPILTAPFLVFPGVWRSRKLRPLAVFLGIIAAVNLFQLVLYPYHLGPVIPIVFTFVAAAIRQAYITLAKRSRTRGVYFALAISACLVLVAAVKQNADLLQIPLAYWDHAAEPHREARASIQGWLSARARPQLVLVRYGGSHSPDQEWIYNGANIDRSKVVWARDLGPDQNAKLLHYFSNREAWLLEADEYPQHVVHYERAMRNRETEELVLHGHE